jgi:hypothetical protein
MAISSSPVPLITKPLAASMLRLSTYSTPCTVVPGVPAGVMVTSIVLRLPRNPSRPTAALVSAQRAITLHSLYCLSILLKPVYAFVGACLVFPKRAMGVESIAPS